MNGNEKVFTEIKKLRKKLSDEKAEASTLTIKLEAQQDKLSDVEGKIASQTKALALFQNVAINTQKGVEKHISGLVTTALDGVFDDSYIFRINFETRRNKTECDLLFERDGELFKPMDSAGGGTIDVASLALRFAVWSIQKSRPVIVLDEPCKFVSKDLLPHVVELLTLLSSELGIQMIMVSHVEGLKNACDRIININGGNVIEEDVDGNL